MVRIMDHNRLTLLMELHSLSAAAPACPHPLKKVTVGAHYIYAGAARYLTKQSIVAGGIELFIPLSEARVALPKAVKVKPAVLPDFGGVCASWGEIVNELAHELNKGTIMMCCCQAGHGRTGTFLASLVSVTEPNVADPIAAVRRRYCPHAVETTAQAEAIFALRKEKLPIRYRGTFAVDGY